MGGSKEQTEPVGAKKDGSGDNNENDEQDHTTTTA
jgi:hypothetical protein